MKIFFLSFLFLWGTIDLCAQKKSIGNVEYRTWPYLDAAMISNNGNFISYSIKRGEFPGIVFKMIVQSTNNDWKMEFSNIPNSPRFTPDSRYFLFKNQGDSLGILNLESKAIIYEANISSFTTPDKGTGEWIVYSGNDKNRGVFIRNLKTGKKSSFSQVSSYWLSENGKEIIFQQTDNNSKKAQTLTSLNLANMESQDIFSDEAIENVVVDFQRGQLAFKARASIWYYKKGTSKAICLADSTYSISNPEFELGSIQKFSKEGGQLFIHLKLRKGPRYEIRPGEVEIWSYTDIKLQSQQDDELNSETLYLARINLEDRGLVCLQRYDDELCLSASISDKSLLTYHQRGGGYFNDRSWIAAAQPIFELINAITGERKELDWLHDVNARLSPEGKYIIYFDNKDMQYCSYDLANSKHYKITTPWLNYNSKVGRGVVTWFPKDDGVLVYDNNDVWKLDPSGKERAVNLTNGYGLKSDVIFSLVLDNGSESIISKDKPLIFSAFNNQNKTNGFFSKRLDKLGDPEVLTMGAYVYHLESRNSIRGFIGNPIKAKNAEKYIVQRMSATESPNYFSTSDFKSFIPLSNFQPQKDYNWYTAELHSWRSGDGRSLQGILYKPEDFDLKRKYPVIFYCYERLSDGLNAYLKPESNGATIDIATYVSNGYLVFLPDIYYKIGDPMQGTYDAVVSAIKYVRDLPFVKSNKIGIQGHSFGGIQINYLITKTNLFTAACSSSSIADMISGYGTLSDGIKPKTLDFESGQYRMGSTLWENLQGYIKNSPVLNAHRASTPLLMKEGKKDTACPYPNALEFFLGLRRLGKKVWMLVYPDGGHTLDGQDAEDFDVRMMQFFDHYLKDKSAPIWMLDGIPASRRYLETHFVIDSTGRTPGSGILTKEQQYKSDSLFNGIPQK